MKTAKDSRFGLVKDQYALGKIHSLKDFYSIIPKGAFSTATGISAGRLKNPESLHIGDLIQAGSLIKVPAIFLFNLFDKEKPFEGAHLELSDREQFQRTLLHDSIGLGSLRTLSQIFDVIPRSTIAGLIGTNNNNMREFIMNPEPYNILFVQRVAWALMISPGMLFASINNQLRERKGQKPEKIRMESGPDKKSVDAVV